MTDIKSEVSREHRPAAVRQLRDAVGRGAPERSTGFAWIAAELRRAITDGVYAYGERLPPERELAHLFGASRATVRKALDSLEAARLIARRVGSGTFVSYLSRPGEDDIAEITNPLELIEVRLAVEPDMLRIATLNATARDIDRLGETLAWLEGAGADAEDFTRYDQQFHQLLAECTHNPLFIWIYSRINEVRGHAQWHAMKDQILTLERIEEYNRQHRILFEALRSRDVDGAVRIINAHLDKARRDLLGVG